MREPGNEAMREPWNETEREPGNEAMREPWNETEREPGNEAMREPWNETEREPGNEAVREPRNGAVYSQVMSVCICASWNSLSTLVHVRSTAPGLSPLNKLTTTCSFRGRLPKSSGSRQREREREKKRERERERKMAIPTINLSSHCKQLDHQDVYTLKDSKIKNLQPPEIILSNDYQLFKGDNLSQSSALHSLSLSQKLVCTDSGYIVPKTCLLF